MLQVLSDTHPLVAIASGLRSNHIREYIPDGVPGTEATIDRMQKLCSKGKRDFEVRKVIGKIVHGEIPGIPECQGKDHQCYAQACYQYCRDNIKYAYDPALVEYVENPARILESRIADCDSIVMLLCAMWENIGLDAQYVTIMADPSRPNEFSHVYARVKIPGVGWVVGDPTMPKKFFGWEPPGDFTKRYWPASTDDTGPLDSSPSQVLSGLRGMRGMRGQDWEDTVDVDQEEAGDQGLLQGMGCSGDSGCGCGCDASLPQDTRAWKPPSAAYPKTMFPDIMPDSPMVGMMPPTLMGLAAVRQARRPKATRPMRITRTRKAVHGMYGLGASRDDVRVTVLDVLSGDTLADIKNAQAEYQQNAATLDAQNAYLLSMPEGPAKEKAKQIKAQAEESLRQQFVAYRSYRDTYNDFVTKISPVVPKSLNPGLAGIGIFGVDDAVVFAVVAFVVGTATIAALVDRLSVYKAAANGQQISTKGWLEQYGDAVSAGGATATKVADAAMKLGVVAAIAFIGYTIFKNSKGIQKKIFGREM